MAADRVCKWCRRSGVSEDEWCPAENETRRHRLVRPAPDRSLGARQSGGFTPASTAQREKTRDTRCLVCGELPADPAHLIPRSVLEDGQEDPRATIPLCRQHHRDYDNGRLDLLPFEAAFTVELAFAVERYGLIPTLQRVTNTRYVEAA